MDASTQHQLNACPVYNADERSRDAWQDSIVRLARVENEQHARRALRKGLVARGLARPALYCVNGTH